MGNQVNDIAFMLDSAAHRHHTGREDRAPVRLEHLCPDNDLAMPVSFSNAMNMTPLPLPERWRKRTMPAVSGQQQVEDYSCPASRTPPISRTSPAPSRTPPRPKTTRARVEDY